jgi:hypothetical protein
MISRLQMAGEMHALSVVLAPSVVNERDRP